MALTIIVLLLVGVAAHAIVALPHIFSDHMVLQQQKPIPVWGTADPGEQVTVTFAGQLATTVADAQGQWVVRLKACKARTTQMGQTLTVLGKNTVVFRDVLIGEVWVCSGQSNMQMAVASTNNAAQEITGAIYPQMRLFTVPDVTAPSPQVDCGGQWSICTPETVPGFSAVGYYFGRHLHQTLKVPVGLINTSWGGTVAEAWTSAPALRAKLPEFSGILDTMANPSASAQQAMTVYQQRITEREKASQTMYALEDDLVAAGKWAASDLDDSKWQIMDLPGNWKEKGLPDVDGIVWFRKTIDVPASWAGKEIILRPGPIDEVDNAWFNGTLVGGKGRIRTMETSFWNVPREYHVPGALVKAGANVVSIRVFNAVGQAGLWGTAADTMFVELADGTDKTHLSLAGDWRCKPELILPVVPPNPSSPNVPSVLFNGMINPLIPYAIRGAIWYQGESNADRPVQYQTLLPTMIADWRTRWQVGEFPFLIVSLANFMGRNSQPEESGWAELREAQALTTTALPNVGLGIAIDIGDATDIHPRNKQDVGLRLALAARAIAYKQKLVYSGPVFKALKIKDGKAEVSFLYTGKGLVAKGEALTGFAICGSDHHYVWAQAKIVGAQVVVWSDKVANPVAVRYAWANNPECNLYNSAGLPAVPFRTDRK